MFIYNFDKNVKAIIPRRECLANNELSHVNWGIPANTQPHHFIYVTRETQIENHCEIQIFGKKNRCICQQVAMKISKSVLRRVDESGQRNGLWQDKTQCQQYGWRLLIN